MPRVRNSDVEPEEPDPLNRLSGRWTWPILCAAFAGARRFKAFEDQLNLPANTLARRLDDLVANRLLERRVYSRSPPREEYWLTPRGHELALVAADLQAWARRHWPADQAPGGSGPGSAPR